MSFKLADHRIAYLDYEGPGAGNRGEVRQWDSGDYQTQDESAEQIVIQMQGRLLAGRLTLTADQRADQRDTQRWTASFEPDRPLAV